MLSFPCYLLSQLSGTFFESGGRAKAKAKWRRLILRLALAVAQSWRGFGLVQKVSVPQKNGTR